MKEVEAVQFSEENITKLDGLVAELKTSVLSTEESEIFFIKNSGLALILRLIEVPAAISLLYLLPLLISPR